MTTDAPHIRPADDDIGPTAQNAPGTARRSAVSPAPGAPSFPERPALPPAVPAVTVLPSAPAHPGTVPDGEERYERAAGPEAPPVPGAPDPPATAEAPEGEAVRGAPEATAGAAPAVPEDAGEDSGRDGSVRNETVQDGTARDGTVRAGAAPAGAARDETGDEAVHTLLWTAATERPVDEVAALVARLQATGELSSPADVALRAAAVTRPLGEVRELLALLNASGYDLRQAETTLRAAAVGRPIEDVVQLVGILGADSSDWRPTAGTAPEREPGAGPEDHARPGGSPAPAGDAPKRGRGARREKSRLDGALAAGPGSHTVSPALRSVLRWPAAAALFACGLVHLPTDLAALRAGGDVQTLTVVVTVLCLVCAVWLAARDTLAVWAAAAGLSGAVIALHGVASARAVDLLSGSLGAAFAWAKAAALLSAVAIVFLAGSALMRRTRAAGTADGV
ncbi:hypothetical protein [Streptomyces sp. NPDC001744]|uniref:hypothetical protein n=1 Tax=Streptomyces sp. NPDC001744 TaxID=3364606 RepID=UPI003677B7E6